MEEEQKKAPEFLLIKKVTDRECAELAVVRKAKRDTKEGRLKEQIELQQPAVKGLERCNTDVEGRGETASLFGSS